MSCKVCGSRSVAFTLNATEMYLQTLDQFRYAMCSECRSLSLAQDAPHLDSYYKKYFVINRPISKIRKFAYRQLLSSNLFLSPVISFFLQSQDDLAIKALRSCGINKSTRIVDIGCGPGTLVQLLQELGYHHAIGIDPYLSQDESAPKDYLRCCDISDLQGQFDLILFNHSFEHLQNPKAVLDQVRSLLSPKGVCVIRIPNIDSYSFKFFKNHWFSIHPPFHMFLPSHEGMALLTRNSHLKISSILGEQLVDFFLHSASYALGVPDYHELGTRRFLESGQRGIPPLFTKGEMRKWKQRKRNVENRKMTDWRTYYISHNS